MTYRDKVLKLGEWSGANNLALDISKTKELALDFLQNRDTPAPLYINRKRVEKVEFFKFLRVHFSLDPSWSFNISALVKKARQKLHFLRVIKEPLHLLVTFYHSTIESLLTYAVSVWYSGFTEAGRSLDTITTIYNSPCLSRARIFFQRTIVTLAFISSTCCFLADATAP